MIEGPHFNEISPPGAPRAEPADEPIEILADHGRGWLHRALVLLGPLGLAINIFFSLWVSQMTLDHFVSVQVESAWLAGEQLAVRAQLMDVHSEPMEGASASLRFVPDAGRPFDLGVIDTVDGGVMQGTFVVPKEAAGAGALELTFRAPPGLVPSEVVERVPVDVVQIRQDAPRELSVAGNALQWGDDTDPQPELLRIDLRPQGRILAGFRNTFWVRVTDLQGRPHRGEAEISLVSGEFAGKRGAEVSPPLLKRVALDRLGMLSVSGDLTSDVIRFEVRVLADGLSAPAAVANAVSVDDAVRRRFRLVSYAGGVRILTETLVARPEETIEFRAAALSVRRAVYVDVHGPDGAWVDTLTPPLRVTEGPRFWIVPAHWEDGAIIQFEAYRGTTAPKESSAISRVLLTTDPVDSMDGLWPLIERQRELIDLPRVERDYDMERERRFLDHLEGAELDAEEVKAARTWLLGSLPVELYGPPAVLNTRAREEVALHERKRGWIVGLRWFLLGGGALFLSILGADVWRSHQRVGRATAAVLLDDDGLLDAEQIEGLAEAKRQMLMRGLIVIAFVTTALLLTISLLESLVWIG